MEIYTYMIFVLYETLQKISIYDDVNILFYLKYK